MKNLLLSVLLLLTAAPFAPAALGRQDPPPPPKPLNAAESRPPDLGRLEGGQYVNNFFGLSLAVPQDWVIVSGQRHGEITEESKKLIGTADARTQAQVNSSFERSTILLALTKLPAGQPGNAGFMVIAERVPSPAFKSGADVLRSMEGLTKGTQLTVEFQGDIRTEQLGGAEFATATIRNSSPYGVFMQKAYITVKNGYALQLFYTYTDEGDLKTFDAIIKSIKAR